MKIPDFLSKGNSTFCSISHREIFAKKKNAKALILKNEGQDHGVEERDLGHSTRNVERHIGDFF